MIPNVTRGGRARGLLRYLTGPEQATKPGEAQQVELHTNPRLVAGSERLMAEWAGYDLSPRYNPSAADQIAAWLDQPRLRSGTRVTVRRKSATGGVSVEEGAAPARVDAHIWHCSLSLHPDEPALSDQQWQKIAEEFVQGMGFDQQQCRWLALRHGASAGGNDHVHVVVQLVGETGRAASVHNDRPRAQEQCRQLEERYGLRRVEGREAKRGARATSYRQRYRTEREHDNREIESPEPDRELLVREVRRLAAASFSEGEFVRRLRAEGLIVRPRFAAGREDQVVGYSVALTPAEGKPLVPHAGGRLAKDLTLPRLRGAHGWSAEDRDAIQEWRRAFDGQEPSAEPESNSWVQRTPSWDEALEQLRQLRQAARQLPTSDRGAWAQTAAHSAAVLYGWAKLAGEHAPTLRALGRELALDAEIRAAEARLERPLPQPRSVAVLCAAMMRPENQTLFWLALAQELQGLAVALHDMHQAAGEAQSAARLAAAIRGELAPLTARLDDEHAATDRDYAETRTALRLARAGQRPHSEAPPAATPTPPVARPTPRPRRDQTPRRRP